MNVMEQGYTTADGRKGLIRATLKIGDALMSGVIAPRKVTAE
ncbi:hypothetical protein [Paracoccus marinaquae]|nr:hypothetical protein [Paracoccus marinaquae]